MRRQGVWDSHHDKAGRRGPACNGDTVARAVALGDGRRPAGPSRGRRRATPITRQLVFDGSAESSRENGVSNRWCRLQDTVWSEKLALTSSRWERKTPLKVDPRLQHTIKNPKSSRKAHRNSGSGEHFWDAHSYTRAHTHRRPLK